MHCLNCSAENPDDAKFCIHPQPLGHACSLRTVTALRWRDLKDAKALLDELHD
jgi:hypothetical protein